jgi:hypothetical protein
MAHGNFQGLAELRKAAVSNHMNSIQARSARSNVCPVTRICVEPMKGQLCGVRVGLPIGYARNGPGPYRYRIVLKNDL